MIVVGYALAVGVFLAFAALMILNGHPWFGGAALAVAALVRVRKGDDDA